jgi:hypothetical protein
LLGGSSLYGKTQLRVFCRFATLSIVAFWRLLRGLLQIDSALTRICFPGRDADDFFAIGVLLTILWLPAKI